MIDNMWVSASAIRNYLLGDPILDWLQTWPSKHQYQPDQLHSNYTPETDFNIFLQNKALAFEQNILRHFQKQFQIVQIASCPQDISEPNKARQTQVAIEQRAPIIYQAVLHEPTSQTFGAADFLVRVDVLNQLVTNATQAEAPSSTEYRVVDVKYTTLKFMRSGIIGNSTAMLVLKAQLYIYNRALSQILGSWPPAAYILGRSWKQENSYGLSCLERLGPVYNNEKAKNNTKLSKIVDEAVRWVRKVRQEGDQWDLYPQPSVIELYPNMGNQEDAPWRQSKKEIAKKLEELTLLWKVGLPIRNAALKKGLSRWSDEQVTPESLGFIPDSSQSDILADILYVNRDPKAPVIQPETISANQDVWRTTPELEFYVDFETVSDLNDDFGTFPLRNGQAMIFMIGCGHMYQGHWYFHCFIADQLELTCEKNIIEQWLDHMQQTKAALAPDKEEVLIYHWSPAEVSTYENAYKSAQDRHPNIYWPTLRWFDFLQEVIRQEPVTIKGAFSFGLKAIAKAMYKHGLIHTNWADGPTDGLGAMVAAWNAHNNRQGRKLGQMQLIQDIQKYNEVDCKVMMEIIQYLRENH